MSLFRGLPADAVEPDDVVLSDRLYGTFADRAQLWQAGVDRVFRWSAPNPEMVRQEAGSPRLAYHLLRSVMTAAGETCGKCVRALGVPGTLQLLHAVSHLLITCTSDHLCEVCDRRFKAVAEHLVGARPDCCEPRNPTPMSKAYPRMTQPREIERTR